VPVFKPVQPAKLRHHVQPRAHPQMEGVAQDDLGAHVFQERGITPLTVP
jgi:hypothetical protein